MEIKAADTRKTEELAMELSRFLSNGCVVALYGDLGSGKTTFTRFLVKHLGFTSTVQSPTFVIAREYSKHDGPIKKINHLDLYRLTELKEAIDMGIKEFLDSRDSITVVEWPEIIEKLLPPKTIKIYFKYSGIEGDLRDINVQNLS